jgi:competence protein ComEC
LNDKDHFSKKQANYLLIKISGEPKLTGELLRFTATVEADVLNGKRTPVNGNLLITIKDSTSKNLCYDDELLIPSIYRSVEPPLNPAEFNYKKYLANQNIHYQEFLYAHQYYILNRNAGNSIVAYSLLLRQRLVEKFKRHLQNPEAISSAIKSC